MGAIIKNQLPPFSRYVALTTGLFITLAITFTVYALSEKQIDHANDRRHQSFLLADELRQSSDDLTRMARTYVVTRDPVYKSRYQEIRDIRDGKKPRPQQYQGAYWSPYPLKQLPDNADKPARALLDLIRQTGVTGQEFRKLEEAKTRSDQLTATEAEAMRLAETAGPEAEASRVRAREMLFDEHYHQAKAAIMQPIDEFDALMDKRMRTAIADAETMATILRIVFIAVGLGLMLMLIRTYRALHATLGGSVADVYTHITRIGGGDLSTTIPVTDAMKDSVLGWLAATQVNLDKIDRHRRTAEAALTRTTEMLEGTGELARVGGWELDIPTMTRSWSLATFKIHELDPSVVPTIEQAMRFYSEEARPILQSAMQAAIKNGTPYDLELPLITAKGRHIWVRTQGRALMQNGKPVKLIGAFHDITERKQAEQLEQFRSHTLELLAGGKPLPDILEAIVHGVEQLNPAMFCSILLLDSDGKHFSSGVAPSLPDFYNTAINNIEIGPEAGSCGTAAFTGERVIVADIASHPYWVPYRELATRAGLGACWSQPVHSSSGHVLGTFAIYHHEPHEPTACDINLIEQSASLASIAIERSQVQASLVRTAEMLERTGALAKVGGWESSPQLTEQLWSLETCRIYDIDPPVTPPITQVFSFYSPEVQRTIRTALLAGVDSGTPWDLEVPAITAKGRAIWVRFQGNALRENGKTVKLFGACQDITERKQAEAQFQDLFESSPDAIIVATRAGIVHTLNRQAEQQFGYTREELIGQPIEQLIPARYHSDHVTRRNNYVLNPDPQLMSKKRSLFALRRDGSEFPADISLSPIMTPEGLMIISTIRDITERKTAEDNIERLAFYDPLTRLPNRRLLLDRLGITMAASVRHQRSGALLFIDLDDFKTINDTLGHNLGDLLLEQVAQRLSACVREGDTVARVGGDEFVVMLDDLNKDALEAVAQAETVGEKILAALGQPYSLAGDTLRSTPSIGITLFGDQHESTDELLKRADLAMYQAKAAGRNTLRFFDPQMQAVVTTRAALETGLREAIRKKQFLLHYQAQVDGKGRLSGVEALVRWNHPQRGMVSPAEFIPLAEDTGLILPLGHWVLETACTQLATWAARPEMAHLCISVNVSPRQFHQSDFVHQVLTLLVRTGANPKRLKLELTESLLIANIEDVITKMSALKAQGVCFSLDDFGTGYSSLAYLKRLPLNQLKIDQGFVRDILIDPNDAAIAKMIVVLAESLGLEVIAEGVETEAQRNFLAEHGCPAYQGYLFSRPLPIEEFETFAARVGHSA
ncbi:MAG: EAL domain-containing protein [bacterium]|nr:EAL domain-containing protein [bacterium]